MNSRERFTRACRGRPVDRPPVWLMRQAGRYLPEYRRVRGEHTFWEMVRTPALATEVTLQPVRRFGMDAAILFCDILVVLDAMGVEVRYEKGGPVIEPLVRDRAAAERLKPVRADRAFDYAGEAIERLSEALHPDHPIIGFAGAPFTLAAYLVQGGPSRNIDDLKELAYRDWPFFDAIAGRIADVVADLLALQARAGADAVQIFDTWAWHLVPDDYDRLAMPYTRRVIERLRRETDIPVIAYVRNAAGHLESAAATGCDVVSVDGSVRLAEARRRLGDGTALQGNFDPAWLRAPAGRLTEWVQSRLPETGGGGYIANLGQGLTPQTPVEGVQAFVDAVKSFRYRE